MDRNKFIAAVLIVCSIALSACAQRTESTDSDGQPLYTGDGVSVGGTDPDLGAANLDTLNLRVVSDVNSMETGGVDVANITALVTDSNNNAVEAKAVVFSSTGGVLQNISQETDENGEAGATLKISQDFQNQDIVVTVSSEAYSAKVKITALGSSLDISGPETLVLGDKAQLVISLTAGNGEPISNQEVTVESAVGNTIEPSMALTDSDGRVTVLVGTENFDDTVQVTALNGTVSAIHRFEVAEDVLKFDDGIRDAELPVSVDNVIAVLWTNQGVPVTGSPLRFSTTAGEIVNALANTNAQGRATIELRSSSAGPAKISVEAADDSKPNTSIDIEFVATNPSKVAIDASSTRVQTAETSTVSALVTDTHGNPVKNRIVDFTSADLKGGQLNPASAKSDSAGIANVTFTAGENATQVDDISIIAQVKNTVFSDTLKLTVVKRVLNVTIGTSNEINVKPLGTQYAMPFIVQVADGSGTPLENATVKLSVRPVEYRKGRMVLVDENGKASLGEDAEWDGDHWAVIGEFTQYCESEDQNGNRVLDESDTETEDVNGNGLLDPQDPAALTAVEGGEYATIEGAGALSTDKNGSGFFELLYPASNSLWASVEITARAEALGEETTDTFMTSLPLLASEILDVDVSPANVFSPYGTILDCTDPY